MDRKVVVADLLAWERFTVLRYDESIEGLPEEPRFRRSTAHARARREFVEAHPSFLPGLETTTAASRVRTLTSGHLWETYRRVGRALDLEWEVFSGRTWCGMDCDPEVLALRRQIPWETLWSLERHLQSFREPPRVRR